MLPTDAARIADHMLRRTERRPALAAAHAAAFGRQVGQPALAFAGSGSGAVAGRKSAAHRIALALVWLAVFSGFFVVFEPAPFDAMMMGLLFLLPAVGLTTFNSANFAYLVAWLVVVVAGFAATGAAVDPDAATLHMIITLYLVLASFVVATFVARNPEAHARLIFRAWTAGAVVAALLGTIGYFDLVPGSRELFTVHARATSTFKDPNVFAPFLVPPLLYLLHEALSRTALGALRALLGIVAIVPALLLSFSRGAWAYFAIAVLVYGVLAFITARTSRQRLKLIGLTIVLGLLGVFAVLIVLGSDTASQLLAQRAAVAQSYDEGPEGRFGGQLKALALILENPFGLGALQFGGIHHPEHPHNVYLSQFLNGGWIGGLAYIAIILAALALGWRAVLARSWPARTLLVVYASFVGLAVEGLVVETDHWRAFYLVLGLLCGIIYPSRRALGLALPAPTLPGSLAMLPLAPSRRPPRIANLAPMRVVMSPVAPRRRLRRHEPTRRARIILH